MTGSNGNIIPFNPLDKKNLGASVAEAMLEQKPQPLSELKQFFGVGIYAIYYTGDFSPYGPLSARNRDGLFQAPIYVGKAVPKGARKGGGVGEVRSRALYDRLREHAESVELASNLDINDFCDHANICMSTIMTILGLCAVSRHGHSFVLLRWAMHG
ncbi:Eco29kI family restriction endonuclease, partial [Paraburkholderia aspalathi]|uniref:Eco29kI family restriction endonuclease n=1 Tax=Paraburkholderia nemoris TaxID=2793076 RepID=UPI00190C7A79